MKQCLKGRRGRKSSVQLSLRPAQTPEMADRTLGGVFKLGLLLLSLAMLSYLPLSASVSLDLTELRNRVSKIKVNPRGNLWATGHFMGRKSVPELKPEPRAMRHPQRSSDSVDQDMDWVEKMLKGFTVKRKR